MELASSFDLHGLYVALMVLAFLLTLTNPLTRHFPDKRSRERYYTMQMITALCAVLGAKFAVLLAMRCGRSGVSTAGAPCSPRDDRLPARCCSGSSARRPRSPCFITTFRRTTASR